MSQIYTGMYMCGSTNEASKLNFSACSGLPTSFTNYGIGANATPLPIYEYVETFDDGSCFCAYNYFESNGIIGGGYVYYFNADGSHIDLRTANRMAFLTSRAYNLTDKFPCVPLILPSGQTSNGILITPAGLVAGNMYTVNGEQYMCVYNTPSKVDSVLMKMNIQAT